MISKTIKTICYALIFTLSFAVVAPIKAVVTGQEIANHLVKKTMTSQTMEEYVLERFKFRISLWQEEFKAWQKRWNIVTDIKFYKDFKVSSLSDQAFNELCKIPFYIFVVGNNEKWLAELRQDVLSEVYVYSDPEAQKLNHKWYNRVINDDVPGFTSCNGACTVFINDYKKTDDFQAKDANYHIYYFFQTIEHELTHVEQRLEAWVLGLCVRNNNELLKVLNFIQKEPSWRQFTTRFTYELFYLSEQIIGKNIDILDHSFLSSLNSNTSFSVKKGENEADKVSLKFFEFPSFGLKTYKDFFGLTELSDFSKIQRYNNNGYCTKENKARLIIKRLIKEGHMKVDDRFKARFAQKEKVDFPRRKLIQLPMYFDFHNAGHIDEHGQFIMRSRL